jgi:hypothetical protein
MQTMLSRCYLKIKSLGLPWYWDMWNVNKGRGHWNYFDKCNRKVWNHTMFLLWGWWVDVLKVVSRFYEKIFFEKNCCNVAPIN